MARSSQSTRSTGLPCKILLSGLFFFAGCIAPALAAKKPPKKPVVVEACTKGDECVLSCPVPKGCCSNPCGCKRAINQKYVEQEAASVAKTCARVPHCPQYGCVYEPAYGATCREGRCVVVTGPGM